MTAVCENCAGEDEELAPVWPEGGTTGEAELWCSECRSQFPNEAATDDEEG
jgi:hypothetical protein